mmetsp:Transcript_61750/g.145523  ORF Transcript_61750/g.145523 Transcript_61750/m.145523 type:complete len:232 (+) Transcript_61750:360-1055(+)
MTRCTPRMSSPRAATSVAITIVTAPSLNLRSVDSRWLWLRSPLMLSALNPCSTQCWWIHLTSAFMFANTSTFFPCSGCPASNPTINSRNAAHLLVFASSTLTRWVMALLAEILSSPRPTVTLTASLSSSSAIAITPVTSGRPCSGHVAEKKRVWCASGSWCTILRMSRSNPMSSMRSASSSTSTDTQLRLTAASFPWFRMSSMSISRPGVATIISHPLFSAFICGPLGAPP